MKNIDDKTRNFIDKITEYCLEPKPNYTINDISVISGITKMYYL